VNTEQRTGMTQKFKTRKCK